MNRELVSIEFEDGGEVDGVLQLVLDGGVKVWTTMGLHFYPWRIIKWLYVGSEEIEAWRCMVANLDRFYQQQQGQGHQHDRPSAASRTVWQATA